MKQFKNTMLVLAGGLLATMAIVSCGKDKPNPPTTPAPTIASITPSTGPVGTTVTITGTNLTGSTVKFNGTTATTTSITATSITTTVPAGATTGVVTATTTGGTATGGVFTVTTVPTETSDDVATANLIAHWTFNDTRNEKISLAAATATGTTTYVDGRIGKAILFGAPTGTDPNFVYPKLVYPPIPAINSAEALANGFTVSVWVKLPVNQLYSSIFQINGNIGDIFGLVGLAYRKNPVVGDATTGAFDFNGALTHVNATGTHSTAFAAHLEGSGYAFSNTAWTLLTMTYDDATRKIAYYGDGVKIGEKDVATSVIAAAPAEKFELLTTTSPGGNNQVSFGSLNTNPPFAVGPAPATWQGGLSGGALDDVRLFNKALTQTEITQLFTRGSAGK